MGKLSDLLSDGNAWDSTLAAGEFEPLPAGEYAATITKGELTEHPTNGTPTYKLTFQVDDGPHAGRCFFADLWITQKAMPYTKRDLLKLGITTPDQLEQPLASRYRCKVKLAKRKSDSGVEYNRVVRFDVLAVLKSEPDPFAPKPAQGGVQ